MTSATLPDLMNSFRAQTGETLGELSRRSPILVVFLRHCGCTFAREALGDVARQRPNIEKCGTAIVIVHMHSEAEAAPLFAKYQLADVPRISDPEQRLYQGFEVQRGSLWQVMGPANILRAFQSLFKGHMSDIPTADIFQLPGAFLVKDGQIVSAFRGKQSSDRPDYAEVAQCKL